MQAKPNGKHPFQAAPTASVCVCGRSEFDTIHFGDDPRKVRDAIDQRQRETEEVSQATVGTRVRVRDSFPGAPGLRGLVGPITYREITRQHPQPSGFCTVQFPGGRAAMNVNFHFLVVERLEVPKFASLDEAEAWLEEHNPVPQPEVPRFASREEADRFLEGQPESRCGQCRHRRDEHYQGHHVCQTCQMTAGPTCNAFVAWDGSCKECGDPDDHGGKPHSEALVAEKLARISRNGAQMIGLSNAVGKAADAMLSFRAIQDGAISKTLQAGDTVTFTTTFTME